MNNLRNIKIILTLKKGSSMASLKKPIETFIFNLMLRIFVVVDFLTIVQYITKTKRLVVCDINAKENNVKWNVMFILHQRNLHL